MVHARLRVYSIGVPVSGFKVCKTATDIFGCRFLLSSAEANLSKKSGKCLPDITDKLDIWKHPMERRNTG